ncbi:hypothetical protein HYV82_04155 [Candidatus Woesearchaeota archaeon]|nr:hypothetical protein [Candidatus Woesearchaeota archaeon]
MIEMYEDLQSDIYEAGAVEQLLEDDELSPEEEAFMMGYDSDMENE